VKNPKALLIAAGAIALIGFGFFFVRGPKPIIEIKGEPLITWGDYGTFMTPKLLNTQVAGFLTVIVVTIVVLIAMRGRTLIPRGFYNAVEAVAEAMYNISIQMAGEKNGRRFFAVAATLFVFIWISNWLALTPIFNSFGAVQKLDTHHHFYEEVLVLEKAGGVSWIFPFRLGGDSPLVELEVDEAAIEEENLHFKEELAELKAAGASQEAIDHLKEEHEHHIEEIRQEAIDAALPGAAKLDLHEAYAAAGCDDAANTPAQIEGCERKVNIANADVAAAKLKAENKHLGVIYPYFRSFNTDLNSPLALALIAVMFVEFWGITALGLFKYGGKFIRNPLTDPIGAVVGFLEIIGEFARIISFTFRLFGNMLAGEILLLVMTFLIPFLVALPFYGLEVFVGAIQGFVFFALTIAFGALAVASHDHEDHDDEHELGEHDVPGQQQTAGAH
jgi:F0F1-type ATP synthase membrane subunit a